MEFLYACLVFGILVKLCAGQVKVFSPGNEDEIEVLKYKKEQARLKKINENSPLFKKSYVIDINKYTYTDSDGYSIGIIIDPCKGLGPRCCIDAFGDPAYIIPGSDKKSAIGAPALKNGKGVRMNIEASRVADRTSLFDPECFKDPILGVYRQIKEKSKNNTITIKKDFNDPVCVDRLHALEPAVDAVMPACWDYNQSVNAIKNCYTVDNLQRKNCITVGYMQTSFITQCGGEFALDNHCGTFLELHKPGDEAILSQTRLLAEYSSGYRTTTLPLYYKGNRNQTICRGEYEVWWVQRTKYNFIVELRKKFYVKLPLCDFDKFTNLYLDRYTIGSKG